MKRCALYIHIPFCARKCAYCDFTSYAGKTDRIPDADFYGTNWWFVGYYFTVVFVGKYWLGGSLSRLSKEAYGGLLLALAGLFCFQWTRMLMSLSVVLPTLIAGLFLFALGGYIRKFDPFQKVPSAVLILAFVLYSSVSR